MAVSMISLVYRTFQLQLTDILFSSESLCVFVFFVLLHVIEKNFLILISPVFPY